MSRKRVQSLILVEGIREDVLQRNLSVFFGSSASYERMVTKDGRSAYLISSDGVKATQAMVDDLRAASRKVSAAQSNPKSPPQYVRSSEQAPYPPQRHDSRGAKSDIRQYSSDPSSAFSPRDTSGIVSPRGLATEDNTPRAVSRPNLDNSEVRKVPKDYRLFPENEEEDALQQSTQSEHPPRRDSRPPPSQESRMIPPSGPGETQRGSGTVPIRQTNEGGQDRPRQYPDPRYRSPSQKRAETESRHRPEIAQSIVASPPQVSYTDQSRSQQSYASSYSEPISYLPGQSKTKDDFKEFKDWLEYRRQKDAYERERHSESQRTKYDELSGTPPPRYSEIGSRQHKPRQPSPDGTHGNRR